MQKSDFLKKSDFFRAFCTDSETRREKKMEEKEVAQSPQTGAKADADKVLRNHIIGSMGVGLIPVPLVDFVALTGIQLNMLRRLAKEYGVPFSKDKVKNTLASLLGSGLSISVSGGMTSLVKSIPVIGQTAGALAMPVLAGATTYAVGKVFIQHFASGGTFLDFDPEKVKDYYAEMFKEGEKVASEMKDTAS
jgi:uncharacterized protein (DUF697 family)